MHAYTCIYSLLFLFGTHSFQRRTLLWPPRLGGGSPPGGASDGSPELGGLLALLATLLR